jgi:hypothetical protein
LTWRIKVEQNEKRHCIDERLPDCIRGWVQEESPYRKYSATAAAN